VKGAAMARKKHVDSTSKSPTHAEIVTFIRHIVAQTHVPSVDFANILIALQYLDNLIAQIESKDEK
jgi:hypothetical protein